MEKQVRIGILYDLYGALLNEHQREIMELSLYEDLSLAEIAAEVGTSRQSVSDLLGRCRSKLEKYEEKLRFSEKLQRIRRRLEELGDEKLLEELEL